MSGQLSLFTPQFDERVRRVEVDGVTYFSVLDVLEHYGSEGSAENPSKYWGRAKKRLAAREGLVYITPDNGGRPSPYASPSLIFTILKSFQPTNLPKAGYVYIVRCTMQGHENLHKIGMTRGLKERMISFKQFPFKPELVLSAYSDDARKIERRLHKMYAAKRVYGEWFQLDSDDLENIKTVLGGRE